MGSCKISLVQVGLEPGEEGYEAPLGFEGVVEEALGLGSQVPVLGTDVKVSLFRDRRGLVVDQRGPVEEHVEEEDEEEAERYLLEQVNVVLLESMPRAAKYLLELAQIQ